MDFIDSQTTRVVQRALDGLSTRHATIAGNLANAETPGYKALQVSFEEELKAAVEGEGQPGRQQADQLKATDARHFIGQGELAQDRAVVEAKIERSRFFYTQDKNGVDLEQQMAALAKNTGRYQALSKMEAKMFMTLRNVLKGGP